MKGRIDVRLTPLDIYPVGSIYLSTAATNPAALFGGTWQAIEGRFLLAAGGGYAAGSMGGEAAHTLTIAEMPSHTHLFHGAHTGENKNVSNVGNDWAPIVRDWTMDALTYTGGGQPHNNLPPYLAVYVWKRTA